MRLAKPSPLGGSSTITKGSLVSILSLPLAKFKCLLSFFFGASPIFPFAVDITTHLAADRMPIAVALTPILPHFVKGEADHDGGQEESLRELLGEHLKSV